MTTSSIIARPYAVALFQLAHERKNYDHWSTFLARASAVANDARVVRLIQNPRADKEQLLSMFVDLCVDDDTETQNFLRVLFANNRVLALSSIAEQFERMCAEEKGTMDAELVTAFAVSDAQKEKIAAALSDKLGRRVRLSVSEDQDLIGGAVVRAGDWVIDGSVRAQLDQFTGALRA